MRESAVTEDALLGRRVRYLQPARGYRVSVEALLLARAAVGARTHAFAHVVDLGGGPGAVALALVVSGWARRATVVEIDAFHAELAMRNAALNGVADRVEVVHASVERAEVGPGDLVVTNPPYFDPAHGPLAVGDGRAAARAFVRSSIDAFVETAARSVRSDGDVVVAFPSSRLAALTGALDARALRVARLRFVHPKPQREAQVALVTARRGDVALAVAAPLYVRTLDDNYTEEVRAAIYGDWPTAFEGG